MKSPIKPASRVIAISLVVVAVGGFLLWQRNQGPRYKGKTVEQWIRTAQPGDDLQTDVAIRAMLAQLGTNAIPPLLQMLDQDETNLTKVYRKISQAGDLPQWVRAIASERFARQRRYAVAAAGALRLLGTNAALAIPELERIAQSTNYLVGGGAALWALAGIGKPAGPAIARLKSNAPPMRRVLIRTVIEDSWQALLQHHDPAQREEAALGLSWSTANAFAAIPVLETMRESPDAEKRETAMQALSRLGKYHGAARDALLRATNSDYENTQQMAKEALDRLGGIRKLKTFD